MTDNPKDIYRIEAKRHLERMDIRDEDPDIAAINFFKSINPSKDHIVAAYWPKNREFDTGPLLHRLLEEGISVCLPVMQKDTRVLSFVNWVDGDALVKGPHDILQPQITDETEFALPDIVVVPMLAFDRKGHRLGYGGGYYDATLNALRAQKDIVAVGVAYSSQAVLFNLPSEEHDEQLDWVITPKDVHSYT